jgi:hypothetical protein
MPSQFSLVFVIGAGRKLNTGLMALLKLCGIRIVLFAQPAERPTDHERTAAAEIVQFSGPSTGQIDEKVQGAATRHGAPQLVIAHDEAASDPQAWRRSFGRESMRVLAAVSVRMDARRPSTILLAGQNGCQILGRGVSADNGSLTAAKDAGERSESAVITALRSILFGFDGEHTRSVPPTGRVPGFGQGSMVVRRRHFRLRSDALETDPALGRRARVLAQDLLAQEFLAQDFLLRR